MWLPFGTCTVNANTTTAGLGFLLAEPQDRYVWFRFTTTEPANPVPLSFAIIRPISATENAGLPEGRYYPNAEPSVVALGPAVGELFTGKVIIRPRSYNTRWLMAGYPSRSWTMFAEVWAEGSSPEPWFNPSGFVQEELPLQVSTTTIGPAGAAPLRNA